MKQLFTIVLSLVLSLPLCGAQSQSKAEQTATPRYRNEFITYSTRNLAEKGDRQGESYFIDLLQHRKEAQTEKGRVVCSVEIPLLWRDRDIFLHLRGYGSAVAKVNGLTAGSKSDSRTPAEFYISNLVGDGVNTFEVEFATTPQQPEELLPPENVAPEMFIYSQPPVRIDDIEIEAAPDAEQRHGVLRMKVIVSSSRSSAENISVGYDIYSPAKELKYYDLRDVEIGARGVDTVEFSTNIYGAMDFLWSAASPKLYDVTVYLKRNRVIAEYLSLKVGFGTTTFEGGKILRNGRAIDIKAVDYQAATDRKATLQEMRQLKKEGINTLYTLAPQPYWFYELCDSEGFYVVDRAAIATDRHDDNRRLGGTIANDPAWCNEFIERQKGLYYRNRLHPSIIAWSMGTASGGGYNMYKAYEWFKSVETIRPVVYPDGEWNNDLTMPAPRR
ncbi:MAG: glycoside hydrolase family 2 TIM barrel-domain containing protein [Tidjanibacter sp.]|nr:glycoside hydrolase family 2 TIM barrel-domain containing protein [Tidjanibacter sp.]